jgi:Fe-S oxidoreductase
LHENTEKLRADGYSGPVKMLTSCPSCVQGLQRYQGEITDLEVDYIVVEMAREILGKNWMKDYIKHANAGGIERVLV